MKNYTITVNGNVYDVTVEEGGRGSVPMARPMAQAPVAAPVAAPAPAPTAPVEAAPAPKAAGSQGKITVNAPMPGKIIGVKVEIGQTVKKGDVILVLEAMKMENEIVAPEAGTIASINVVAGAMVEAGDVLSTLN